MGGGKCGAFPCSRVGAYCIRPTNVPPKEGEGPAFGRVQAFAIYGMALGGAYAIRPYPDGQKMIAVGACFEVEYEKQAAFWGCYGVGGGKCGAFSCPRVGAYCIRPTDDPFIGRMIQMIDHRCAFLSPAGPFGGAYSIRPYPDGRRWGIQQTCIRPYRVVCGAYSIRPYPGQQKTKNEQRKNQVPGQIGRHP